MVELKDYYHKEIEELSLEITINVCDRFSDHSLKSPTQVEVKNIIFKILDKK